MRMEIIHKPTVPEVASEMASEMVSQFVAPFGSIAHLGSDVVDSAADLYRRLRQQDSKATPEWENNHLWIGLNPT